MDEPEVNPYSLTIKSSKGVLNEIITQASMELFGTCALTLSTRVPRPGYKAFVRAILKQVWERELRRLNRSLVTAAETRDKCKGALETLTPDVAESPTWENLKEASVSLKKYKDLVKLTGGEMDESIRETGEIVQRRLGCFGIRNKEGNVDDQGRNGLGVHQLRGAAFPPQKEGVEELTENLANAVSLEEGVNANLLAGLEGSNIGVSELC
ncbi:hypothetical protein RHS01_11418 [Rhizoctonia solani]|uniref:Uncharacterized protein n=1 Tax=Rhizoctonia solani TaxID=456999 RepID=A0A8H7I505_9AGAM|nr:hypothetical protein RHS01_11418 [Rhizoctonia solani]